MRLMAADNLSLVHVVRPPQEVVSGKPPLLLLLHGIGSHEQDLFGMAPLLDKRFFVVSARAPIMLMPGGYGWFNIQFMQDGAIIPDIAQAEASTLLLVKFIDELIDAYGVDPNCVYLMGFSQGAMMSLSVALTHPDKVSRVVAMSGRLAEQAIAGKASMEEIRRLEVFVTHGTFDNVLPVEAGRACRDELVKLGIPHTYREYPMAHEVTMDALRDVTAWLKSTLEKGC
jgi:phospholipase/carboxylesterase